VIAARPAARGLAFVFSPGDVIGRDLVLEEAYAGAGIPWCQRSAHR
jgi:hypothetical protein